MEKVLIIVDMQNDFIDGALANSAAQEIVGKLADLAENWKGRIIFTRDTHGEDYLETQEGKKLPVKHCIKGTYGWQVNEKIERAARNNAGASVQYVDKPSFGAGTLLFDAVMQGGKPDEITFTGTCTDICVVSNALILKSFLPETEMFAVKNCCAGLTKEKHEAAIEVMKSCQIDVI